MNHLLQDPNFQKTLALLAQEQGKSLSAVTTEAEAYIKELYTVQQPVAGAVATQMAQYILSRGYDKTIDVNPLEIKELGKLMRRHPVAFVMTHKTYIDMFVLAVALVRNGLPLPYTFSGINMSFMGLGQLGRQVGVIFIRRSFKDNLVYKASLRHLIANLVDEKAHFMWALEGTRSRTGKLVWPKMGILKYIMEAEQDSRYDVQYVPVSIVYDLIPDVKDMTQEGRGRSKNSESLSWFMNYVRKMGEDHGRISLRIGEPVLVDDNVARRIPDDEEIKLASRGSVPQVAFELVHRINEITPVTTTSLICTTLLSKYSLTKRAIERDVANLMDLIESHKLDALVDRGKAIGLSVQVALNLLGRAGIVEQKGSGLYAEYTIVTDNYLPAVYYANMAVQHLYQHAFIEIALSSVADVAGEARALTFWQEIMRLRDLFKFEFFYSAKAEFSDEIETDLARMIPDWKQQLADDEADIRSLLEGQRILVAHAILHMIVEAYRVVAYALRIWDAAQPFDEKQFLRSCQTLGEKMQWQGRIQRIEAINKPFLLNGIRLASNRAVLPGMEGAAERLESLIVQLDEVATHIDNLQGITLSQPEERSPLVPIKRDIVPGSKTAGITREILEGETGPQIAAFFDLDRTLINGFSAKEFYQSRLLSGRATAREIVGQFSGVILYAVGNGGFAALAAVGARGVRGIKEKVFIDIGEEIYLKTLADAIYPESRALVAAHMAMGHTVAIVSAATPYQVNPIARDLGVEHVMCTRLEVENDTFTGKIIEPACWGEGKAIAGQQFAEQMGVDLSKSYFYTDSAEDLPLLEIVGQPRPLNPDVALSALAFQNDWPVYRFHDEGGNGLGGLLRTGLTLGAMVPAALSGAAVGAMRMSWRDGVNSMMRATGELGTAIAGIELVVEGEENLWAQRPAVFIFNHQSNADLFINAKLLRQDARGIAKKELLYTPFGPLLLAAGVIFVDRGDRKKAIAALQPAVDALKNGISIAIAPEGTRSYDYRLGPFKKGAFHIAMQAGVPVVPIVIQNAHDVLPRGGAGVQPTAVKVTVLPPIATDDWTVETLNGRVAAVRAQFLETLGQPPDPEEVAVTAENS